MSDDGAGITQDAASGRGGATPYPAEWGEPHTKLSTWFWPEDLRRSFADISGIELMRGIAEGRFPPPPIMSLFDARILSVEPGEVIFGCIPDRSFLNPAGMVHGGFLCTIMDTAIGCAVITESGPMQAYATIELKVSFFKPMPLNGQMVEVVGSIQSLGRRVAFAEAHAYDGERNLLGHATSSLAAVSPRP
jgi:uncharacterized protein (TIGR00369 family)